MGKVIIAGGGGSGAGSDECTATRAELLKGYTAVTGDSDDEAVEGILEFTGDAADSQVLTGKTYYNTNPKNKRTGSMVNQGAVSQNINAGESYVVPAGYHNGFGKIMANSLVSQTPGTATAARIMNGDIAWVNGSMLTGTMVIQSILSFSAAVYSSTAITFTWQNPAKGPFSGVIIVGKTGSYPTSITDGTKYYKGSGNNTAASGISGVTIASFSSGATYYFRIFSYATLNSGEWVHTTSYTVAVATTKGQQTIYSSGTFTVPTGVRSIDVFMVGGGGGGYSGDKTNAGSGGGGGYTKTVKGISVTPGQNISVVIGSGGAIGSDGGSTSFGSYSISGGKSGFWKDGGSGGGSGTFRKSDYAAGNGGSNGGNGEYYGGTGQGATTRAFGESSGTLYSGGGGGGGNNQEGITARGFGGSGGGGNGADAFTGGSAGSANTGGGGGGGYFYAGGGGNGYVGGSGVCIVRWGY
ncbi:MAG: hypothetical protein E7250_09710 [Paenibacillaceae bacterium]|nr:hypothetical protein [Paenibacillaceae bacterium]